MACAGIDFGNKRSVVAIARRGGIDICCNEVSNRSTPTLVAFGECQRHLGESAATLAAQLHRSTVGGIQRLLGVDARTPFAKAEAARLTCTVTRHEPSNCSAVKVHYAAEGTEAASNEFTYQAIAGMFFGKLLEIASAENKAPVRDCVISVPGYYTEGQRRALLDAATIANINVLRVVNEHAAIALSYGIFRTKELPDTDPIHVAFVDVGEASTSATIAAFTKSRCDILSTAFDPSLGGRDLDEVIAKKFAAEWSAQHNIDAMSRPRAKMRLYKECEKLKRILSANSTGLINIECLMDDKDVSGKMSREELEELAAPIFDRLRIVCTKAIEEAKLAPDTNLIAVEIVGAGTRVPAIKAIVEEVFKPLGAPLRTTLNMDECIARGAALMSAMLSPAFRVRDYAVSDVTPFALNVEKVFASGAETETMHLVNKFNQLPCLKALSFKPRGKLNINVKYADTGALTQGETAELLSSYEVNAPPPETEGKVKAKIRLTANGICEMAGVSLQQEVEVEEEVQVEKKPDSAPVDPKNDVVMKDTAPATDSRMEDVPATSETKDAGAQAPNSNSSDAQPPTGDAKEAPKPVMITEKRLVKKIKSTDVEFKPIPGTTCTLTSAEVLAAVEKEAKMKANDLYIKERSEAMNSLEAYVYDLRSRIDDGGDLKRYGPADVRGSLRTELDEAENWIYSEEGDQATKSMFVKRKEDLVAKAMPMLMRKKEDEERPVYTRLLEASIESHKRINVPGVEEFAHLTDQEKQKVLKSVESAALWLKEKLSKQAGMPLDADPAVKCSEIQAKREEVDKICRPIVEKPKPKPKVEDKKTEEKKGEEKKAAGAPEASQNGKGNGSAGKEETNPEAANEASTKGAPEANEEEKMDVDTAETPNGK